MNMLNKEYLKREYAQKKRPVSDIAKELGCSENKVTYWLQKHLIKKRSISEAIYQKNNPTGDPFKFQEPKTNKEWFLYGLGLGLYWGEGNKMNTHAVRLGNTDPGVILQFLDFLEKIYHIDKRRLRFGLQIFSDVSKKSALQYWTDALNVPHTSFQKVVVTKSSKVGTYKVKNEFGVLTIYFSNIKLRDSIVGTIDELRSQSMKKPS